MTDHEPITEARNHAEIQALLRDEIAALRQVIDARLKEIATLTEMLESAGKTPGASAEEIAALERRHAVELLLVRRGYEMAQQGPRQGTAPLTRQAEALEASELFDIRWYLEQNRDVAEAGMDPIDHYIRSGAFEGRDPGPSFRTLPYYLANPDVAEAGWPALVHYVLYGRTERRAIAPE
ncbi:hypothetical protein [Roseivivax isoporae]|uniref:Uncharacterized protein n=1 Tax=Roseivivax isoporae LMG 25204 TaxID=1449351 RepID=X7F4K6_9RHOB|nr:hypothetical protein [Roseivivax isoporae]ETX26989.1 hypothetical protein RISW2_17140 [Roseivivax isoporae LMG 25204]